MSDTFEDYRSIDALNWTRLKKLRDGSPLHFRTYEGGDDNDVLRLGRLAHAMLFEPGTVDAAFPIWTGKVRNGKVWEAFETEHAGKTIITTGQFEQAAAMVKALKSHPAASAWLSDGIAEQTLTWTDEATGLRCKCRTDFLSRRFGAVVDLKGVVAIEERAFRSAMMRYGWHCQLAHYRNGAVANGHFVDPRCALVAVEKKPPFDVGVFVLDAEALEKGAAEVADLLARVKACTDANEWPGRYPAETTLGLPVWATMGELEMSFDQEAV